MAEADLSSYLLAQRARVDAALERYMPRPPECPSLVSDAMRYSLFAGGKRLRPILALAAAEAVADAVSREARAASELALPAACAIEMIHTYSLIHDDLPAMDNDTMRRGRPTAHVVFGEGMAILAGDGLLTEAFRLMARAPDDPEVALRKLRTIHLVAKAAGSDGMVGGQAIDLQAQQQAMPAVREAAGHGVTNGEALQAMHARKTGALIRAAAAGGAIMAGAPDPLIHAIDRFAAELGLAFQIVDDILDVEGDSSDLGKTAGKDAAAGKPTYPAFYGLDQSRALAAACIERAHDALRSAQISGRLPEIAGWVVGRRN